MANVNIDELEKYCTQEGISNFGKMQTDETREGYEYHRGLATAFDTNRSRRRTWMGHPSY